MKMIVLQLILFCLLFTALVKFAVRGGAIDGLYFYPKPVQERAIAIGLTDRETMDRKRKQFMIPFVLTMLVALLLIIGVWNGIRDYKTAYLQALLFLEVMNWYDVWILPGTEDQPFVQTWGQVLKKRGILTLIWIAVAAIVAGLILLIF